MKRFLELRGETESQPSPEQMKTDGDLFSNCINTNEVRHKMAAYRLSTVIKFPSSPKISILILKGVIYTWNLCCSCYSKSISMHTIRNGCTREQTTSFQIYFGSQSFRRLGLHQTSLMEPLYVLFSVVFLPVLKKVSIYCSCKGERHCNSVFCDASETLSNFPSTGE